MVECLVIFPRCLSAGIAYIFLSTSTLHPLPYALYPTPSTLCPMPYALCPIPVGRHRVHLFEHLYPTPSTLHPLPYTLYPMPSTLRPLPYTLYPMPHALYLSAGITSILLSTRKSAHSICIDGPDSAQESAPPFHR
jgi:hypothetical protein